MVRKTMLEENLEKYLNDGFKVFKYGRGMKSNDKRSNMGRTMAKCELMHPRSNVRGVIGGRAGNYWNDGYHWAVVYKGN